MATHKNISRQFNLGVIKSLTALLLSSTALGQSNFADGKDYTPYSQFAAENNYDTTLCKKFNAATILIGRPAASINDPMTEHNGGPLSMRTVKVTPPPGNATLNDFIYEFTRFEGDSIWFMNNRDKLSKMMREWCLAHEVRHGDQPNNDRSVVNEADADVYAFRILKTLKDTTGYQEVYEAAIHMRTLSAIRFKDFEHATSFSLQDMDSTAVTAEASRDGFEKLYDVLQNLYITQTGRQGVFGTEKNYAYTYQLYNSGTLSYDENLERAAKMYIEAYEYFMARQDLLQQVAAQNGGAAPTATEASASKSSAADGNAPAPKKNPG